MRRISIGIGLAPVHQRLYMVLSSAHISSLESSSFKYAERQTIYAKMLNEIRQKLRNEQYEDEKKLNVVSSDMTLDEWFDV